MKPHLPISLAIALFATLNAVGKVTVTQNYQEKVIRTDNTITSTDYYFESTRYDADTEGGEVYLTADGTASGGQLNMVETNFSFEGAGTTIIKGANIINSGATTPYTSNSYAFVVNSNVLIDGADLSSDIGLNVMVGTRADNENNAVLELTNGAKFTTSAIRNIVGAMGNSGTIIIDGVGTTYTTQQTTLGANFNTTLPSNVLSGTEIPWTPKYLCSDDVYSAIEASDEIGHGTINITNGGHMFVGKGNTNYSNNKLQIFNGDILISGSGTSTDGKTIASTLELADNSEITMCPQILDGKGSSEKGPMEATLTATNGGIVKNSDGTKLHEFEAGIAYGATLLTSQIKADNNGQITLATSKDIALGAMAFDSSYFPDATGKFDILVQANNAGTISLSSDENLFMAGYTDVSTSNGILTPEHYTSKHQGGSVVLESSGTDSSINLTAQKIDMNDVNDANFNVKVNVTNGASIQLETTSDTYGIYAGKNVTINVKDSGSTLTTNTASGTGISLSNATATIGKGATWTADKVVLGSGSILNNDGTLLGSLSVAADAQVNGSGTFSSLELATGATLVVGNSPGLQSYSDSLTLAAGSTTVFSVAGFEIMATTDNCGWNSGTYSSISLEDGATLNLIDSAMFTIAFGGDGLFDTNKLINGALSYSETFSLILIQNAGSLSNDTLTSLLSNTTFSMTNEVEGLPSNGVWDVNVTDASYKIENNNLILTGTMTAMIPEPSTATLSLLALAALATRRRRK